MCSVLVAKDRYTLATKLNLTRSTLLKVDRCRNRRQIDNKVAVADTVDFVADAVDFVADTVDFVASV